MTVRNTCDDGEIYWKKRRLCDQSVEIKSDQDERGHCLISWGNCTQFVPILRPVVFWSSLRPPAISLAILVVASKLLCNIFDVPIEVV